MNAGGLHPSQSRRLTRLEAGESRGQQYGQGHLQGVPEASQVPTVPQPSHPLRNNVGGRILANRPRYHSYPD